MPAIHALVQSAFRGEASRSGWTTEADLLDGQRTDEAALTDIVDSATGVIVLAEEGGRVVACCHLEHPVNGVAYLGMVSVEPQLQAGGVGRAVLAEAERRALARAAGRMRITVIRQRSELIKWYERLGYRRTGESQPFPYGDERFGRPRVDDLEFVVLEKQLTVA